MKILKFIAIAGLFWLPVVFGLGAADEAVGIPDTDTWMLILRIVGGGVAACASWAVVSTARATDIAMTILPLIGVITNVVYLICVIVGTIAVVMVFVKDADWLNQRLYVPYVFPCVAGTFFSLVPTVMLLTIFRKTRPLGGICLYLLSLFFGFALWFYSLMVAGSHGTGWVIGGLLLAGLGVIFTAILSSVIWGHLGVAGSIFIFARLIISARMFGWFVAERQLVREATAEEIARSG